MFSLLFRLKKKKKRPARVFKFVGKCRGLKGFGVRSGRSGREGMEGMGQQVDEDKGKVMEGING